MQTILLVDDDDLFAGMLAKFLERAGYTVVRAHNGVEALKLYNPKEIALIVTDLVMPEKEGLEFIMELRRAYHGAAKIIAMSGGGRGKPQDYLTIAKRFGALKTLAKPFPPKDLVDAIAEILSADSRG